jgi:hypothetical protein
MDSEKAQVSSESLGSKHEQHEHVISQNENVDGDPSSETVGWPKGIVTWLGLTVRPITGHFYSKN